jgi:hypothetical protein
MPYGSITKINKMYRYNLLSYFFGASGSFAGGIGSTGGGLAGGAAGSGAFGGVAG